MVTRRGIVGGGLAAAVLAAFGLGATAMAITNPSLNLQPGDVTRLRNARDILNQVASVWSADARYSSQLPEITEAANILNRIAQEVEDYLVVQGT